MPAPSNGIYIISGEMNMVMASMKKGSRWSSHAHQEDEQDSLLRSFSDLKEQLKRVSNLSDLEPIVFLKPFLDVVRAENTTGPVTGLGLAALAKFLSYGLIDPERSSAPAAAEQLADAVTHARFVGTDSASDEVVLLQILQVLRLLLLTPLGRLLTNEAVCEIMQSCFRFCFETRLSELLRRSAEHALMDMVQILFSCLPHFTEDSRCTYMKKFKMHSGTLDAGRRRKRDKKSKENTTNRFTPSASNSPVPHKKESDSSPLITSDIMPEQQTSQNGDLSSVEHSKNESEKNLDSTQLANSDTGASKICSEDSGYVGDKAAIEGSEAVGDEFESLNVPADILCRSESCGSTASMEEKGWREKPEATGDKRLSLSLEKSGSDQKLDMSIESPPSEDAEYVNPRGVRFTQQHKEGTGQPYGLPCVRELFRYLVSLVNPHDRHNTEPMLQVGLNLLTVGLETGADHMARFPSLLALVRDEACRNLIALLSVDRLTVFSATLRVCFLLFESLRTHLKFQVEVFLKRLSEVVVSERSSYEQVESSLDCILQLWRIPGLVTELYLNYDCHLYCSNLLEDITKMLSKHAYPLNGVYSVHLLSLEALLAVIESIEQRCLVRISHSQTRAEIVSVPNRMKVSDDIPSHETLMALKHKKKILQTGTEQFNSHPGKGISFLQEHGLLQAPLDPDEVAAFLRHNPQLDKKRIGDYISGRKNLKVLDAFVRSFSFVGCRIDEALRQYLETFRLPGEAPLISLIMEHFADHWHRSAGEPFANNDAAFTLAYAIIMLNVDQHNHNVKKQNIPMTFQEFKKNLKGVNGGQDFDENLLEEIYSAIKNEEIVMPAEQTGIVKENYLWKVLLRRGATSEGTFVHAPSGLLDRDIFQLCWGPTVAALSFIVERSPPDARTPLQGVDVCATVAAHYDMSDVFDHLIISLCKFSTISATNESPKSLAVSLGSNSKAQAAARALFRLAHRHGDILREGWKNILDCVLQLYRAALLPAELLEAEDFVHPQGVISLVRDEASPVRSSESGLLSSFYSYIVSSGEAPPKPPTLEEEAARKAARDTIQQCHPEHLFTESKFLREDSLNELVKTLVFACRTPEAPICVGGGYDEDATVFHLELLVKIVLLNRDRVQSIWTGVSEHLLNLVVASAASDHTFLLERAVVGILRIAVRLVRKEDMIPQVLQTLRVLLYLKHSALLQVSRQAAVALHELFRANAANIHAKADWALLFGLLERVGAGAKPHTSATPTHSPIRIANGASSDSELSVSRSGAGDSRGYTSDSGVYESPQRDGGWTLVGRDGDVVSSNPYSLGVDRELHPHDSLALLKCCESLACVVREHLSANNMDACIRAIRTFVEATADGGASYERRVKSRLHKDKKGGKIAPSRRKEEKHRTSRVHSNEGYEADDEDKVDELAPAYHQASLQLLDLLHTLHTRAATILVPPPEGGLWAAVWCPLLQGVARVCCDSRRAIRTSALTLLPRALLVHDLHALTPLEWEDCFNKVLFPLLAKLLENISPQDPVGMEETRMRGATLLCKVFLQHLSPLLGLPTFTALWLTILEFMDKYMHAPGSDLLAEAIPESLKNMLLVMETARVFAEGELWHITWDRIHAFLPNLRHDLLQAPPQCDDPVVVNPPSAAPLPLLLDPVFLSHTNMPILAAPQNPVDSSSTR